MTDKKILIVDFDEESLASLSDLIDEEGFQTETAKDGQDGYEKFKADHFDLVILEPMLPKLHGFELCKKINQDPKKKVPIIVVTGIYREPSCKMEALQVYGVSAFFTKPWNKEDLRAKILQLLVDSPDGSSRQAEQPARAPRKVGDEENRPAAGMTPTREARMSKDFEEIERELRQVVSDLAAQPKKKEVKESVKQKAPRTEGLSSEIDALLQSAVGEIGLEIKKKKPEESKELAELMAELRMPKAEPGRKPAAPSSPTKSSQPMRSTPVERPGLQPSSVAWPDSKERIPVAREIKARIPAVEKPTNNIPPSSQRIPFPPETKPFRIDQTLMEIDRLTFIPPKPSVEPEEPIIEPAPGRETEKKIYFDEYAEPQKKKVPLVLIGGLAVAIIAASAIFIGLKSKKSAEPASAMLSSLQPSLPAEFNLRQEEVSAPPITPNPVPKPTAKKQTAEEEDLPPAEVIAPAQAPITASLEAGGSILPEQGTENPPAENQENEPASAVQQEEVTPPLNSQPTAAATEPSSSAEVIQSGALVLLDQVDVAPALVKRVEPKYPPLAFNMGMSGTVTVNALISETGDVLRTEILKGVKGGYGFERAAETAVKQWKFRPARKNGVNVKVWKAIEITFKHSQEQSAKE